MAGKKDDLRTTTDVAAILDRALAEGPKVRRPTKTQQLREQQSKIAALRAKGYTLADIAAMVGTSKDTLRHAISKPKKAPKKSMRRTAAKSNDKNKSNGASGNATPVESNGVAGRRKQRFPTNDDL